MIDTTKPDVAAMHDELERLPAMIARAEAALEVAEQRRTVSQAVYDEAARELSKATTARSTGDYDTWSPKSGEDAQRAYDAERDARAAFDQADRELGEALVARTAAATAAGNLRMRQLALPSLIAMATRDAQLEARPEPQHDRLASIRRRLGFGGGPEAG